MTDIWKYSVLVDGDATRETGLCFTTLPIRIHSCDDIANEATLKSIKDWGEVIGDGWDKKSGSALCSVGNWCSFIFPESLPDRLQVITYLANLGNIHDDACEEMDSATAVQAHGELSRALDINEAEDVTDYSKSAKLKKMVSQCLLDCINHDHNLGMQMLESYRTKWLDVMEHPDIHTVTTIGDYLVFRNLNGGMEPFWLMCQFGMAISLTKKELQLVRPIFIPAESALVLTNDYWSWDREYYLSKRAGAPKIVNSIDLFMRTEGMTVEEAREKVKRLIISYEADYLRLKSEFYQANSEISPALRRYIEVCGAIVAGNHYWCANCPRHNAWQQNFPDSQVGIDSIVGEPANLTTKKRKFSEDDSIPSRSRAGSRSSYDGESLAHTSNTSVSDSSLSNFNDSLLWKKPSHTPILDPINYINSLPSKGLRTMLIETLNQWLHVPPSALRIIKGIVDQLHNASLILDDIEDNSPLRRGNPAAHAIFGQAQSINSANFMFVCAVQEARKLRNPQAADILLNELECLYLGQSWDLYYKFNLRCPTEREYLTMVDNKTGVMFRLLSELMQGENSQEYVNFSRLTLLFGRFFQIRDDYMNIHSSEYSEQKGFCEDFDEGKFSYPIVHSLKNNPELASRILGIFRQRPTGIDGGSGSLPRETKLYILNMIKATGSMEGTLTILRDLEEGLHNEIKSLEERLGMENPMLHLLLTTLTMKERPQ